ncbi:centrosomal protein of 131 kDa isoform X2 [Ischnura elegans]|uniref:centrosomal protein of 131 kDa isoform X2 n=1 Tax=Ischnura elegans TaxID=197161 RepID=UPI001ED8B419|nr:centrosomal protein of 131 kDa isoform X2 [Ischnura elegans]
MSEDNGLCLRGKKVNPRPRPKSGCDKSATKVSAAHGRPYSANGNHRIMQDKRFENFGRPKSASGITNQEKYNVGGQSRLADHFKASLGSKKSTISTEDITSNETEGQLEKTPHSSRGIPTRSSILKEDSFCTHEGIRCETPSVGLKYLYHNALKGGEIQKKTEEVVIYGVNHQKHINCSGLSNGSSREHLECEKDDVSRALGVSSYVKKKDLGVNDGKNLSDSNNRLLKSPSTSGNLENVIKNGGLLMDLSENQCIASESMQQSSDENVEKHTMENNLISLLVDIEDEMISCNKHNRQDDPKNNRKCLPRPLNHLSSLLDDDFPASFAGIHSEIRLFEVLCNVDESKKGGSECHDQSMEYEEVTSESSPSAMSSDSLEKNIVEDTRAEITSQIKEVDKILKMSRECLQEDIAQIISIQENGVKLRNGQETDKSSKVTDERPSSIEGSSDHEAVNKEAENGQDTPTNCDTSSSDDFFGDMFHSDSSMASYDVKVSSTTCESSRRPVTSLNETFTNEAGMNQKEKSCLSMENFGNDKNDQFSDDDSTFGDILSTLKVLEKEESEPVLLSARPPPTGSELEHTPRVKLKELLSFLDDVDQSCTTPIQAVGEGLPMPDSGSFAKRSTERTNSSETYENSENPNELMARNQIQEMRLKEQAKGLALLKQELEKTKEKSLKDKEKLRRKLEEEHNTIMARHQEFIEKLLAEKKAVAEKCEALILKLQRAEESHKATLQAMEEHHAIELRNEHERARLEIRSTRDKWIREKTQKIQAATARGAEGEVKRLVSEQVYQIEALWKARLDELRGRLEREAEEGMARERELAKKRLEERVEEMERFHQEERRKFLAEECVLRTRADEAERRVRDVEEESRRRITDTLSAERARGQASMEKMVDEFERKFQVAVSKEKAQRDVAVEAARKEERELVEVEQRKRESKLKDQFRLERDRGIEKAVQHLTKQAEKTQHELEARTEMTLRRMRERCDEQVQLAEAEAEKERKQCAEIRTQSAALLDENACLKASVSRLEKELGAAQKVTASLYEERSRVREVVVEEWSGKVAALREEVGILKAQVAGEKERREMEVAQVQREREQELMQVQRRVEIAIAKKEETVSQWKLMYESAMQKCSQLQELLDKQRKDLLLK